jgi:hypothetical protein
MPAIDLRVDPVYTEELNESMWQVASNLRDVLLENASAKNDLLRALNDRFDEDYNVLLLNLRNTTGSNNNEYSHLIDALDQWAVLGTLNNNPLWHIAAYNPTVEIIPDQAFAGNFQIAIVPIHIHDNKIPVLSKNGSRKFIAADTPPELPTLYLAVNERTLAIPKSRKESNFSLAKSATVSPVASDAENDYYLMTDYFNGPPVLGDPDPTDPPVGPPGSGGDDIPCPRAERHFAHNEDRISRFRLSDMGVYRDINKWFDGGQEFHVTAIFGTSEQTVSSVKAVFNIADHRLKDCNFLGGCDPQVVSLNHEVFRWRLEQNGLNMKYVWLEWDPGDIFKTTTNLIGQDEQGKTVNYGSVEITRTDKSIDLGERIVDYCDPVFNGGDENSTGSVIFWIDQEWN